MDILSFFDMSCYAKCIACQRLVRKDKFAELCGNMGVCHDCNEHLPIVPTGATFEERNGHVRYTMSTFFYKRPIRDLILDYKFNNCRGYSEVFARYMKIYAVATFADTLTADLIIPVPLSAERMKERGYNQSELLSLPIAEELSIAHSTEALVRILPTKHQSKLPAYKRAENLKSAFVADESLVKNKSILLIDDVYTTGNTLKACAGALHKAGARSIAGYTLARKFSVNHSREYNSVINK